MLEKIQDHDLNRPKGKVVGKTQASLWWQYLGKPNFGFSRLLTMLFFFTANKVMENENTQAKTRQKSFITFTASHKYEKLYLQKLINEKTLTDANIKFLRKFEDEQNIGTIIV